MNLLTDFGALRFTRIAITAFLFGLQLTGAALPEGTHDVPWTGSPLNGKTLLLNRRDVLVGEIDYAVEYVKQSGGYFISLKGTLTNRSNCSFTIRGLDVAWWTDTSIKAQSDPAWTGIFIPQSATPFAWSALHDTAGENVRQLSYVSIREAIPPQYVFQNWAAPGAKRITGPCVDDVDVIPLTIATTALDNAAIGVFYSRPLVAAGGVAPYAWSLAPGSDPLPSGLQLSLTGVVSGTPTDTGTASLALRVRDADGREATKALDIRVVPTSEGATLNATPPADNCSSVTAVTLSWNAPEAAEVQIRIDSPLGPAMTDWSPPTGSATTGFWVRHGTQFFLVDRSGRTLATTTILLPCTGQEPRFAANPNPISSCVLSPDGLVVGAVSLLWEVFPASTQVRIRVDSPTGPSMTGLMPSKGAANTENWVKNGTSFFLVDPSGNVIAQTTVGSSCSGSAVPIALVSLSIDSTSIVAGTKAMGTVALSSPAPQGGALITLSSSGSGVIVPASVLVPAGETTATFSVDVGAGASVGQVTISGRYGAVVKSVVMTVISSPASATALTVTLPADNCAAITSVSLTWDSGDAGEVQLRVNSPFGPAVTGWSKARGSVTTGSWVKHNTQFFLVDRSERVLATTTVLLPCTGQEPKFSASPNPITHCVTSPDGLTVGSVTLSWEVYPSSTQVRVRIDSPSGPAMTGLMPSAGSASTENWVVNGTTFYLVDSSQNLIAQTSAGANCTSPGIVLIGLSIPSAAVAVGGSVTGSVVLNGPAPSGGARVGLSSNSTAVTVPSSIVVPPGAASATFVARLDGSPDAIPVVIAAQYAGVRKTAVLNVTELPAPALESLTLVSQGNVYTGTVTLTGPAPMGGASVKLSSATAGVSVPAEITIPPGGLSASFQFYLQNSAGSEIVVTATFGGVEKKAFLEVAGNPITLNIAPQSVAPGGTAIATISLNMAAPAGGASIGLSSLFAGIVMPASVTIPAGATSTTFAITVGIRASSGQVTINASYGDTIRTTAVLTITGPAIPAGTIVTVAGNGRAAFGGDGGPATAASLSFPSAVASDRAGNLYIADTNNHRVRKVSPGGVISTVAGNGTAGFSGDGGPAAGASLNYPSDIAVDADGDLFIADAFNNRIRKVDRNGAISTVAGTGAVGFSGDAGPAEAAALNSPSHIALDLAGNLYISDFGNGRVRKVTADGVITTIAGNGGTGVGAENVPAKAEPLYYPGPLTVDFAGNLFVVDGANNRVRKVTPSGTISTMVANSGTGGLVMDGNGNLYIADTANNRIRVLNASLNLLPFAGTGREGFGGDGGPASRASLTAPGGLALDSYGNLFIADAANARVRMILMAAGSF